MEYINVFDARIGLGDKIKRIQELANEPMTKETCHHLLEELHTACNADSCVNPNEHSLQLSVDDTCSAVNTRTKLKVKVMGEYYDFRNWIVSGGGIWKNTVFVTSETYTGNLGGVTGADEKCQALANEAGLDGTYKAWISGSTVSPSQRFIRSSLPFYLVDDRKIANNWKDLTSSSLDKPINIDENGVVINDGILRVWTNTHPNGNLYTTTKSCSGWTSLLDYGRYGDAWSSNSKWSSNDYALCSDPSHLYCFRQVSLVLP